MLGAHRDDRATRCTPSRAVTVNIIGISAYYHDSACCLLQDGRLVAAAEEERFSRVKHDRRLPISSFRFCLEQGRVGIRDVDCVAYYELPREKAARQAWAGIQPDDASRPEREIREVLGYEGPIAFFGHHQSHAASTYFYSGFTDAAILTVDGVGEWTTTSYACARGATIETLEEVRYPHSLGLLYSAMTSYLGFSVNDGEYKVMGLAPYGSPRYVGEVRKLVRSEPGGQLCLDLEYFDYPRGKRMYSKALVELFGEPPREKGGEIARFHQDVARSLQVVLEEILLEKVRYLHERTGSPNLCLAGGVALNCVANRRILRDGPFEKLFVPPAAGDDGGCLGAAALAHLESTGRRPTTEPLEHVLLGPRFSSDDVATMLGAVGITSLDYRGHESELLEAVAELLAKAKVLGWFHGAMEFGPRALGGRSILADPRDAGMRERINRLVKKREAFRPFAPSVLQEKAAEFFDLDHASPFMLETCDVRPSLDLPAITHVDGSARPQTVDRRSSPRFAGLIDAFYRRTGCPLVLNTSFNVRGEPIVCSPADALRCFITSDLDVLVIEDFIVEESMVSDELRDAVARWYPEPPR